MTTKKAPTFPMGLLYIQWISILVCWLCFGQTPATSQTKQELSPQGLYEQIQNTHNYVKACDSQFADDISIQQKQIELLSTRLNKLENEIQTLKHP